MEGNNILEPFGKAEFKFSGHFQYRFNSFIHNISFLRGSLIPSISWLGFPVYLLHYGVHFENTWRQIFNPYFTTKPFSFRQMMLSYMIMFGRLFLSSVFLNKKLTEVKRWHFFLWSFTTWSRHLFLTYMTFSIIFVIHKVLHFLSKS